MGMDMNGQRMKWLFIGVACAVVAPQAAWAGSEYLKEKTYYKDPSEMNSRSPAAGDFAADYVYTGNPNVGEAQARRQRVETRVRNYMDSIGAGSNHTHDDSEPDVTPQTIANLNARAKSGDPKAMAGMGYAYQHGLGVSKNEKMAVEWYKQAIARGENQYYSTIGDMYRDYGQAQSGGFLSNLRSMVGGSDGGLQKDNAVARQWYEQGIRYPDQDWRSYTALGEMYRDGLGGLEKDMTKAATYYDRGLGIKKRLDEEMMRKVQSEARKAAEKEEQIGLEVAPVQAQQNQQPAQQQQASGSAVIVLDGETCSYGPSRSVRSGYSQVFDVSCPTLRGKQTQTDKVRLPGLQCDVNMLSSGNTTHMLLCNVAAEEDIRIGSRGCSLRPESDKAGYAAVYGAYCNGAAESGIQSVEYRGMSCEVARASSASGKTYTLSCGSGAKEAGKAAASATISARLGSYSCSLREMQSPTTAYKVFYEAYCGGLSEADKNSGAVPGSVSVGVNLCNVEPWPANEQGKDFELYCR